MIPENRGAVYGIIQGVSVNMNEIKVSIITPLYKGTDYIPGLMAMIRKKLQEKKPRRQNWNLFWSMTVRQTAL